MAINWISAQLGFGIVGVMKHVGAIMTYALFASATSNATLAWYINHSLFDYRRRHGISRESVIGIIFLALSV